MAVDDSSDKEITDLQNRLAELDRERAIVLTALEQLKQRRMVPMSRFDPSRAARLCPAGPFLASACNLPAQTLAGASKEGKRSYGSTTRTGLFAQPAGHLMMVPANASLNQ